MATLKSIVSFLDREMKIGEFDDPSNNGLQVAGPSTVKRVCFGVDASQAFIDEAARRGADLLICHHGLSWGDSLRYLTGLNYARVKALMDSGMALYGCHLPLDAHPRHGNNAQIYKALGLTKRKPFGVYRGREIGFSGELPKPMAYAAFLAKVRRAISPDLQTMDFGKKRVKTVAVVSGGASEEVAQAGDKGIDVYLSGEPTLKSYHLAREHGVNAVFAGHYATEVFGVRALAPVLENRFTIKAEFIDFGIPF